MVGVDFSQMNVWRLAAALRPHCSERGVTRLMVIFTAELPPPQVVQLPSISDRPTQRLPEAFRVAADVTAQI